MTRTIQIHLMAAVLGFAAAALSQAAWRGQEPTPPPARNAVPKQISPCVIASAMPTAAGTTHLSLSGFADPALYQEILSLDAPEIVEHLTRSLHSSTLRTTTRRTHEILVRRLIEIDAGRAFRWFSENRLDELYDLHELMIPLLLGYIEQEGDDAWTQIVDWRGPFTGSSSKQTIRRFEFLRRFDRPPSNAWFETARTPLAPRGTLSMVENIARRTAYVDPYRAAAVNDIFGDERGSTIWQLPPPDASGLINYLKEHPIHWDWVRGKLYESRGHLDQTDLEELYLAAPDEIARSCLAGPIAMRMAIKDIQAAVHWVESLPASVRGPALAVLIHHLWLPAPELALELATKYRDDTAIQTALHVHCDDWMTIAPHLAITAMMLTKDVPYRTDLVVRSVWVWAKQNPVEAVRFLNDRRVHDFRPRLVKAVIEVVKPAQFQELMRASSLKVEDVTAPDDPTAPRDEHLKRIFESILSKAP